MASERRPRRLKFLAVGGGVALVAILGFGIWAFPALRDMYHAGLFTSDDSKRSYNGDTVDDLKAIRTALMLYHDSEGAFPPPDHWMNALHQYIRTSDMSADEAMKKFIDPAFKGQPDKYGFALNDAVAGKYKGDIKNPKTPLVFECGDGSRDAHGDPAKLAPNPPHKGGDLAISLDGSIVKLQG